MRGDEAKKRLVDYVCFVGLDGLEGQENKPRLLRRFPSQDHEDFPLPHNVTNFCQPDGSVAFKDQDPSTFVFTLTDKDSNVTRYAVCHNFYRLLR